VKSWYSQQLRDKCRSKVDQWKHIDVRYHYKMDQVKIGNVRVQFTGTRDMVAKVMTKRRTATPESQVAIV
jgi:hypothetical protein